LKTWADNNILKIMKKPELSVDIPKTELIAGCCAALLASILVAFLAFNRNYFTY